MTQKGWRVVKPQLNQSKFTKGSKLPLNKGFKNMFELLQSCAQPSIWCPDLIVHMMVLVCILLSMQATSYKNDN